MRKKKILRDIKILGSLLVIVLVFRASFFEPYRIPSGSMIPTLMIGDFILVNKAAYGLRVPLTGGTAISEKPRYILSKKKPNRGDVIVFQFPRNKKINYVKRIVGMPGDTLEIRDKIVYINDKPIESKEIDGKKFYDDMDKKFKVYNLKFFQVETGEHQHIIQQNDDNYYQIDYDKIQIPKGKYFVMGDNRDFSSDSRFWGLVPIENIMGKAILVWFSMVLPIDGHNFQLRLRRIFTLIN